MYAIQDVLFSGKLGKIKRFQADFSMNFNADSKLSPSSPSARELTRQSNLIVTVWSTPLSAEDLSSTCELS